MQSNSTMMQNNESTVSYKVLIMQNEEVTIAPTQHNEVPALLKDGQIIEVDNTDRHDCFDDNAFMH